MRSAESRERVRLEYAARRDTAHAALSTQIGKPVAITVGRFSGESGRWLPGATPTTHKGILVALDESYAHVAKGSRVYRLLLNVTTGVQ